jgi:hypothetical protein
MPKFTRLPVDVEARQFEAWNDPDEWPPGIVWGGDLPEGTGGYQYRSSCGLTNISDGDWIVTGPNGKTWVVEGEDFFTFYSGSLAEVAR